MTETAKVKKAAARPERAERPDAFELLDSGKATFTLANETYTLDLPKLGQYKALRQIVLDGAEAQLTAARTPGAPSVDGMATMVSFIQHTFAALSDHELLLPEDEWPAWLIADSLQADLLKHWREVPLALG